LRSSPNPCPGTAEPSPPIMRPASAAAVLAAVLALTVRLLVASIGHGHRSVEGVPSSVAFVGTWRPAARCGVRGCSAVTVDEAATVTASLGDSLGALPAPSLEGTRWSVVMDIGRTTFTFMPTRWASDGMRLEIPLAVEFRPNGLLAVVRAPTFLGTWVEPPGVPTLVEFFPFLEIFFPKPEEEPITPAFMDGKWEIADNGKLVQFFIETNGFKRGDIWLPAGKLRFQANAYGQLLSAGRDASVTIRESRSAFGLFAGLFAGITLGPVAFLASGLVSAWQLREVAVCVGRCSISRLPDEAEFLQMSSVRITADDPDKWK